MGHGGGIVVVAIAAGAMLVYAVLMVSIGALLLYNYASKVGGIKEVVGRQHFPTFRVASCLLIKVLVELSVVGLAYLSPPTQYAVQQPWIYFGLVCAAAVLMSIAPFIAMLITVGRFRPAFVAKAALWTAVCQPIAAGISLVLGTGILLWLTNA